MNIQKKLRIQMTDTTIEVIRNLRRQRQMPFRRTSDHDPPLPAKIMDPLSIKGK